VRNDDTRTTKRSLAEAGVGEVFAVGTAASGVGTAVTGVAAGAGAGAVGGGLALFAGALCVRVVVGQGTTCVRAAQKAITPTTTSAAAAAR